MDYRKIAEKNLLYYGVVGSTSYGMNTPTSDKDYKGVFALPMDILISPFFNTVDHIEGFRDQKDSVVYELNKYMKMLVEQNPNILELLWGEPRFAIQELEAFCHLRVNRTYFLSSKSKYTFSGYAYAQLQRIRGHNKWIENPQPARRPKEIDYVSVVWNNTENKEFNSKAPLNGYEAYQIGNNMFGLVEAYDIETKWHDKHEVLVFHPQQELFGSKSIKFDLIAKFNKDIYQKAVDNWKSYWEWKKNRNEARSQLEEQYGYDTKHAAHLVRLLRMGKEILNNEGVIVFRPDAAELLQIRNGAMKYEDLVKYSEKLMLDMDKLYETTKLPHSVDVDRANKILLEMYEIINKS